MIIQIQTGSSKWILPNNFYCFDSQPNVEEFFAVDTNFDKMSVRNTRKMDR